LKDVREPKANPIIPVNKENGKLKRGLSDVSANVDIIGWGPSLLWQYSALSSSDGKV
jgi:hypothetical protein